MNDKPARLLRVRRAITLLGVLTGAFAAVLWARSYTWQDTITAPIPGLGGGFEINSVHGQVNLFGRAGGDPWPLSASTVDRLAALLGCINVYDFSFSVPHWCLILGAAAIAPVTSHGMRFQFSMRTLLTAMTLAALVLGLAMASLS